uniref:Lipoprotein n=1 Tax=Magnetococcus massalia (strain MO-1) TaxID=451514 RepID=A0A1S7LLB3_MAGMO|nr:conserved exported protein of unknown function [Candidatus Magnetococcus massalia]
MDRLMKWGGVGLILLLLSGCSGQEDGGNSAVWLSVPDEPDIYLADEESEDKEVGYWDPVLIALGLNPLDSRQPEESMDPGFQDDEAFDEMDGEEGLLDTLKRKMKAGSEAMGIATGMMEDHPDLLQNLEEGGIKGALKGMDREYLEEKVDELKGLAESAGIGEDYEPSDMERGVIKKFGQKLGLSDDQLDRAEEQFDANRDRFQ